MKKLTRNQHYIPRFILRNFCTDGKMQVADLSRGEARCFLASPESMCFEKDLYETINPDGTYYQRNELEDKFADIEGWLSAQIKEILSECSASNFRLDGQRDVSIALLLALQLTRMPRLKQLIESNDKIGVIEKNFLYTAFVDSHEKAVEYIMQNGFILPPEMRGKEKTLLDETASFILSNCFFYILSAERSEEKFLLADNPVLITPFEDAQYIFPISPNFAFGCCRYKTARGNEIESLVLLNESAVTKINRVSCSQAQRFVMAKEFSETHKNLVEATSDN